VDCGDGVGTAADGELFTACDVCSFPVCRPCYDYKRKEGSRSSNWDLLNGSSMRKRWCRSCWFEEEASVVLELREILYWLHV